MQLQVDEVIKRLAKRGITLEVTPGAIEQLAIDGYDPVFGARPLKRLIQREVVDRVASKIISGEVGEGTHVIFDASIMDGYICNVK